MNTKFVNITVMIVSFILLLYFIFILAKHLDYFTTRTSGVGIIINAHKRSNDKSLLNIQFQNNFLNRLDTEKVLVSNVEKNAVSDKSSVEVYYTKYFSQVLIKGYRNPYLLIILLDLLTILVFYLAIKACRSELKKIASSN